MAGLNDGQAILTAVVGQVGSFDVPLWLPLIATFLTGLAIGWLIWGGRSDEDDISPSERVRQKAARARALQAGEALDDEGQAPRPPEGRAASPRLEPAMDALFEPNGAPNGNGASAHTGMPADIEARIALIEKEIADARAEISEKSAETDQFTDHLNTLDGAVNRANGRLRLLNDTVRQKLSASVRH